MTIPCATDETKPSHTFRARKKYNNGLQAQTHVTQQNRYFRRERMIQREMLCFVGEKPRHGVDAQCIN